MYIKLLMCNSENGDFVRCNKNYSEWGFCVFFKEQKPVSFQENKKIRIEKNRWVVFFKKTRFSQPRLSFKTL